MGKTVYFFIQGQFGNNLFQYFAAEIIKKIYGYDEVKPTFTMNYEFNNVIDDQKFKEIITKYMNGENMEIDYRKDILMIGFFQRSEIFKYEREYVHSLFNENNMNNISNRIKIGNIVKYKSKLEVVPGEKDLTIHLRCGDFWDHEKNRSQIFDPDDLKKLIKSLEYEKLFIVSYPADFEWEKEYHKQFEELNPTWINGNMGDNFDFLMKSNKIITSASTFSYMAAYLGNANEIHIPYNSYYGGINGYEQSLADFNDKCVVHYDMKYWSPKK
jgi:Glycosyl transferase family 11